MLGVSPYMTRSALLKAKATGLDPEVDEATQRLFDDGHRCEALARPLAEEIVGDDLYPITVAKGRLSASLDGATLGGKVLFEHKRLNAALRDAMHEGCADRDLPEVYRVQMEQQLYCSDAERVLFMASEWDEEGRLVEERHCWYEPDLELRARILLGWAQFEADLAAWQPEQAAALVAPVEVVTLPAVSVTVTGALAVTSTFDAFGTRLRDFIAKLPKQPSSDEDFAQAESAVKTLEKAESAIGAAIDGAVAQTASLDDVVRLGGSLKELARSTRLALDKLVKARKDQIRGELVAEAQAALDAHTKALNQRLMSAWGPGAAWMPRRIAPFGDAIKGKKSIAGIKEAIGVMLANEKIAASAAADRFEVNRRALVIDGKDWVFLFADFASVGNGPAHLFSAVAEQRIRAHQEREAEARRAQEAAARAAAQPAVLLQDEAEGGPLSEALSSKPDAPLQAREAAAAIAEEAPTLRLKAIGERLGFALPEAFLAGLGFPAAGRDGAARLYRESSWPAIKAALIKRIEAA
jgi:predicted phage-related endonuclease